MPVTYADLAILCQILEASIAGMVVLDAERRVRLWNRAAARLLGFAADEAAGQPLEALLGAPLSPRLADALSAALRERRSSVLSSRLDRDGLLPARRRGTAEAPVCSVTVTPLDGAAGGGRCA